MKAQPFTPEDAALWLTAQAKWYDEQMRFGEADTCRAIIATIEQLQATRPEEAATVAVPRLTLAKWKDAIEPYETEGSYNNDGVINTVMEIGELLEGKLTVSPQRELQPSAAHGEKIKEG